MGHWLGQGHVQDGRVPCHPVTPRRVIGAFYALTGLYNLSASLIWGVNTLFLLDAGLPIFQVFAANAAFTAAQVLFEIPTGVVADTRGRRISVLLSVATLFVGTLAYVGLAELGVTTFVWWAGASIILGLGFTFYSGAVDAWFVDALQAVGGPEDLDPIFARNSQVFAASMLLGTVSGGLLGQLDLSLPYVARAALLLGLLVLVYLFMHDDGFTTRAFRLSHLPEEVERVAKNSWQHGWKKPAVRLLMLMSLVQMGFLVWGWYAWQPHFLALLGRDAVWVAGVIAAAVSLTMIVGNQAVRWLHGRLTRTGILIGGSIGLAASMLLVGLAQSFWPAVAAFLVGMLCFGVIGPAKQAALHRLIPSGERATIVSFDGLLASAGGVGSQLGLAKVAEDRGYGAGYVVGAGMLALAVPLAFLFRRRVDERVEQDPPDSTIA